MPSGVSQAGLGPLLAQLANDGARWIDAEISLAHAEYHVLRRRYFAAASFAAAAVIFILAAVMVMAHTGIVAATAYFNSAILAGLAMGALLSVIAALCFIAMRRKLRWRASGLILSLLNSPADSYPRRQWTS